MLTDSSSLYIKREIQVWLILSLIFENPDEVFVLVVKNQNDEQG